MNKNPNLSPQAAPMPVQSPAVRCRNFDEVALGYDKAAAMEEARRCLDCPGAPCRTGCPVRVRIPEFIAKVAEGDFDAAWEILSAENTLPAVCGRVCPQENQCQKTCVRGKKGESVAIGRLERFVADYHRTRPQTAPALPPKNGQKVAVVGSGPAGLACAGELAKRGYSVTIFEALHTPGGVLAYGIPAFRLPKSILAEEIAGLEALGVTIQTDAVVGRTIPVEELLQTGSPLVFVGDGINDAPVLARADVGVAMGALGSDAAIEAADIVLMDDAPSKLALAVRLSRRTMKIVWQNVIFALAVKALVLVLGATGDANMWIAVFADVGVLVLAILNAMRALLVPKH